MAVNSRLQKGVTEAPDTFESDLSAYESRPGRVVFVEQGNTDGWLATDVTVDPRP